jgi:hypothetical protein
VAPRPSRLGGYKPLWFRQYIYIIDIPSRISKGDKSEKGYFSWRYTRCWWHLTLHTINVEKNISRFLFHYLCLHNLCLVRVCWVWFRLFGFFSLLLLLLFIYLFVFNLIESGVILSSIRKNVYWTNGWPSTILRRNLNFYPKSSLLRSFSSTENAHFSICI